MSHTVMLVSMSGDGWHTWELNHFIKIFLNNNVFFIFLYSFLYSSYVIIIIILYFHFVTINRLDLVATYNVRSYSV